MMQRAALRLVDRVCPGCGGGDRRTAHAFEGHTIVACRACEFIYLPVAVDPAIFAAGAFAWENANAIKLKNRRQKSPLRTRLDMATRFRTKIAKKTPDDYLRKAFAGRGGRPRVLDIGCGAGGYLAALAVAYTPFGVEISSELARAAQVICGPAGGEVLAMSSLDGLAHFEAGGMDGVVLRSYLEHESQPKPLLSGCHRVLRAGGVVVVKVPNYGSLNRRVMGTKWCGFRYPEHVNYFTPASLARMARETGFAIRQSFFDALPSSDNMWAVLTKV